MASLGWAASLSILEGCAAGDQRGSAAPVRKHCGAGALDGRMSRDGDLLGNPRGFTMKYHENDGIS
jgi:hypothetical protein